ncbi:class I SAM-dependent methyltransferase [Micromonospora sp. WMMD961]|uniref:class I SAM-dependent DNA methyltransferase n=1 Tax=Micromonospora sp. WMMD961 TaxID=3016100 RepID=UPI002415E2E6|nr:class I SAM-dependent methyltransferase [Micromonospora sp. WMMD961]MDG4780107.1 class I SAM-dependent methyltransferase [Micromonospora sp. WMMD961]
MSRSVRARPIEAFGSALRRRTGDHWLVHGDNGWRCRLPVRRWHGPAEPAVAALVARCTGPALDLGCGPGRLTLALTHAGLTAVGVDISAQAVRLTRARGAIALHGDVFAPLPAEGRWAHVLLIDGNIGIGGDPLTLLGRCHDLLRPGGTVLVELEPPGPGLWRGEAQLALQVPGDGSRLGPPFRWARLDTMAVAGVASAAGLTVREVFRLDCRWFGELTADSPGAVGPVD